LVAGDLIAAMAALGGVKDSAPCITREGLDMPREQREARWTWPGATLWRQRRNALSSIEALLRIDADRHPDAAEAAQQLLATIKTTLSVLLYQLLFEEQRR
jgi:hypothetical protein